MIKTFIHGAILFNNAGVIPRDSIETIIGSESEQSIEGQTLLGSVGQPGDIASVAVFLALMRLHG